ncbi:MAG: hypothetical protein WC683_07545 [bacterium]
MILKDFSTFVPEPVIAKIGSGVHVEEVDISIFPAAASLRLIDLLEKKKGETPTQADLIGIVAEAAHIQNPTITEEWLLKHCTLSQLLRFVRFVVDRAQEQMQDGRNGDAGKNPS